MEMPLPTDPHEAGLFICARIDSLTDMYVRTASELIDMQATLNVLLSCVKTIMATQNISLNQEPSPDKVQAWEQIEAECDAAHKFFHTEYEKRALSHDTPLVVHLENPDAEN